MLMRNLANKAISRVEQVKKPRSVFPINFSRKQTMKASYLYPIFFEEVLPSDTWFLNMEFVCRLMPQVTSPMDNLWVNTFFFFDPYRLEWEHFANQHGERKNPTDTISYITPKVTTKEDKAYGGKSLFDYLGGVNPYATNNWINCYGPRMYNRVFNQYFRSENLQESLPEYDDDVDRDDTDYKLVRIGKNRDYFTDCLPDIMKGDDEIFLPLGTEAPVIGNGKALGLYNNNAGLERPTYLTGHAFTGGVGLQGRYNLNTDEYPKNAMGNLTSWPEKTTGNDYAYGVSKNPEYSGLVADLTNATAATVSALRLAIDTMALLEFDNRNGTRYTEILEGRYGALNPDLRLNRVQYLGGTRTPLFTTPVYQTSESGTTPQGNIAGQGKTGDSGLVVKASFGEFGSIMGLCAITSIPQYQQGRDKKYTRLERYDYYYPEFNGLSDQEVKRGEIYNDGTSADDETFGYIGRYDEYRYFKNQICGDLRSTSDESLDVWTYAEELDSSVALNDEFIEDNTVNTIKRTFAVEEDEGETAEQFIMDIQYSGSVARILPAKAIPQTGGKIL